MSFIPKLALPIASPAGLQHSPTALPCCVSAKVLALFGAFQRNLTSCARLGESFLEIRTQNVCKRFSELVAVELRRDESCAAAINFFSSLLSCETTIETASHQELTRALSVFMMKVKIQQPPKTLEETSLEEEELTDRATARSGPPIEPSTSELSMASARTAPRKPIGPRPPVLSPRTIRMTRQSEELLYTGKQVLQTLLHSLEILSAGAIESEQEEIVSLIRAAKIAILENPAKEPVDLYALHEYCTRYLPQDEDLKVEVCVHALRNLLSEWDELIEEEYLTVLTSTPALQDITFRKPDASSGKDSMEKLLYDLQMMELFDYSEEETQSEILALISHAKKQILARSDRSPVDLYALEQYCTKYLPQDEPLTTRACIDSLKTILNRWDELIEEEKIDAEAMHASVE